MSSRNKIIDKVIHGEECLPKPAIKNRDYILYIFGVVVAILSCFISGLCHQERLHQATEGQVLKIAGAGMEALRNNYSYFVFALCTGLFSLANFKLKPNYVVNGICILNFVHGVFAPYFREEHGIFFLYLQFAYAISTSTCWVIVSRIVNPRGRHAGDSLYSVCFFFVFQAMSMIDMSLLCFAIYSPVLSGENVPRIILASVRVAINFWSLWHTNENSTSNVEVAVVPSWNRTIFARFRLLHAVGYTAYWNCLFPFRFASIGHSNDDSFMAYVSFASFLGVVLGVVFILIFVISKELMSRLTVVIASTLVMILSYLIALIYFEDVTLEGLEKGSDERFWLGMFCKFLNGLGTSSCYAVIMAFTSTLPKDRTDWWRTISNFLTNVIFYTVLFKYQSDISAFNKFLILCIPTIAMSYFYWVVEKEQRIEREEEVEPADV